MMPTPNTDSAAGQHGSEHPSLSIVVPAFNEARRIVPTLRSMLAALDLTHRAGQLLVVDDGSMDATSAVVRRMAELDARVWLIRLPDNHGKGYAVRTGVANAGGDRILLADADGATPIAEHVRLEAALDAGAAIAIGSRARRSEETVVKARLHRRMAGRAFHQLARAAGVRGISDTQCGFKLFTAQAAADLFARLHLTGYAFDVELLLAAQRRGYRVIEVPVNWTHQPGSKVHVVRDGLRMAADVLRIRAYASRGRYDRMPALPAVATD